MSTRIEIDAFPTNVMYRVAGVGAVELLWATAEGRVAVECILPRGLAETSRHALLIAPAALASFAELLRELATLAEALSPTRPAQTPGEEQPMGQSACGRFNWVYADARSAQRFEHPVVIISSAEEEAGEHAMTFILAELLAPLADGIEVLATEPGPHRKRLRRLAWRLNCEQARRARLRDRTTAAPRRAETLATHLGRPRLA